jgi:hypothetical protein
MAFAVMVGVGEEQFLTESQWIAGQLRRAFVPLVGVWGILTIREAGVWIRSIRRGFRLSESVFSRLAEFAVNSASFNLFYRLDAYFVFAVACLFLQVWMLCFSDWAWRELLISAVVISAVCFLRSARPPCVLLLGASRPEVLRMHAVVARTVRPLRAVSLLDYEKTPAEAARTLPLRDCLRTVDSDEWRKTVHDLSDMALVVVMDPRQVTAFVREELQWMLAPERIHKLIFVHSRPSAGPIREDPQLAHSEARIAGVPVVDEELLQRVLNACVVRRRAAPTTEHPAREIVERVSDGASAGASPA